MVPRVALALALALVLAACGPLAAPSPTAPLCPDESNYVDQGTAPHCRLQVGQRYIVQMPRSQGSDDALRTICLSVWHGTEFVVNFGALDYCVLPRRLA